MIHSSLKTIIDQMRATVSLVLNSMHGKQKIISTIIQQ